ncbi:hypothetical protein HID58_037108 [Brassica napus]|uniref:Uncharacterized protein n=1 Tax=Brassica napus TaxID=3708 RepID=A0ABQ7XHZ3_BRANA|nr:hypothetical protein HID58_037108 [Brassica napus]
MIPTYGRRSEDNGMKLLATALFSVTFGILLGLSFHLCGSLSLPQNLLRSIAISSRHSDIAAPVQATDISKIWVPSNPKGAERLPPEFEKETERYLVTFTVGYKQRQNIDACVKKFSDNFTIVLFHYDGRTSEWDDEFEWSKNVIHISVKKQTKWWYAKRFLHPDIVARYDYIFIYLHMVKKHGLEISQPGLDPEIVCTWKITKKKERMLKSIRKKQMRNPRGAWILIGHHICGDNGSCILKRCVALRVAYDSVRQGKEEDGKSPGQGVRDRCYMEWAMFEKRVDEAEKEYFKSLQVQTPSNSTTLH